VLAGGSHEEVTLSDAESGEAIRHLVGHTGEVFSVAFSPDGRLALTGGRDKTARVWNVATGEEIQRLQGHTDAVTSVAFSPDGRWALTGSYDRTARVWDVATGKEICRLEGHAGAIESAAFSPDGRRVFTGSLDGSTRLWDSSTGKWLATLVSFREGGWAVVDPEGRYDASDPDNAPGLRFVTGTNLVSSADLKKRFYTPGLLAQIWRGKKLTEIAGRLQPRKASRAR